MARSWTQATSPHHDGTPTEHGFASLFQAPGAGLGLVWLDGRAMKAAKPDEEPSGSMGLRAAVFDRQGAQVSETVVDDRVCECCPTAAAVTSEGPIVAFRDRSQDEIRDIYVSRLAGRPVEQAGAGPPGQLADQRLPGQRTRAQRERPRRRDRVVHGGRGSGTRLRRLLLRRRHARSAPPVRVDDVSALGRVDVELLPDGAAIVSWIEVADQRSEFRIRRVESIRAALDESTSVAGITRTARAVIRGWRGGETSWCSRGPTRRPSAPASEPQRPG